MVDLVSVTTGSTEDTHSFYWVVGGWVGKAVLWSQPIWVRHGGLHSESAPCPISHFLDDLPCAFLLSHATLLLCRPSPCPQHAPCHLCARGNSRLYPLPCGRRATSHHGQVEQGWPPPAGREGARGMHAESVRHPPDTEMLPMGAWFPARTSYSPAKVLESKEMLPTGVCSLAWPLLFSWGT